MGFGGDCGNLSSSRNPTRNDSELVYLSVVETLATSNFLGVGFANPSIGRKFQNFRCHGPGADAIGNI